MINLDNFEPDSRFKLYQMASLHTFLLSKSVLTISFNNFYYLILHKLATSNNEYDKKLLENFPYDYTTKNKPKDNKSYGWTFPRVSLENGFSAILSFHREAIHYEGKIEYNESNFIKLIINPDLIVESNSCDNPFNEYDYARIASNDFSFWNRFYDCFIAFLHRWGLYDEFSDISSIQQLDFSITIDVGDSFNKELYLKYVSKLPRRSSYNERIFRYNGQNDHQSTAYNKSQSVTFYDKNYEQRLKFNNDIETNLLRCEYRVNSAKLKSIIVWMKKMGYIDYKPRSLFIILYYASNIAILELLKAIDRIYPDGDFLTYKRASRRIDKMKCFDNTKESMKYILSEFSKAKDYNDIKNIENFLKEKIGINRFKYLMSKLEEADICPICIAYKDRYETTYLPSPKKLLLSALLNSMDKFYIDRSTMMLNLTEDDILRYINDD